MGDGGKQGMLLSKTAQQQAFGTAWLLMLSIIAKLFGGTLAYAAHVCSMLSYAAHVCSMLSDASSAVKCARSTDITQHTIEVTPVPERYDRC